MLSFGLDNVCVYIYVLEEISRVVSWFDIWIGCKLDQLMLLWGCFDRELELCYEEE